jgi:hypothetical protein
LDILKLLPYLHDLLSVSPLTFLDVTFEPLGLYLAVTDILNDGPLLNENEFEHVNFALDLDGLVKQLPPARIRKGDLKLSESLLHFSVAKEHLFPLFNEGVELVEVLPSRCGGRCLVALLFSGGGGAKEVVPLHSGFERGRVVRISLCLGLIVIEQRSGNTCIPRGSLLHHLTRF